MGSPFSHLFGSSSTQQEHEMAFETWCGRLRQEKYGLNTMTLIQGQIRIWMRLCFVTNTVDARAPDYHTHIVQFMHFTCGKHASWIGHDNISKLTKLIPQHKFDTDDEFMTELKSYCLLMDVGLCKILIPCIFKCKQCQSARIQLQQPTKCIYIAGEDSYPAWHFRYRCNSCKAYHKYGSQQFNGLWQPDDDRCDLQHWLISADTAVSTETLADRCKSAFYHKSGAKTEESLRNDTIFRCKGKDMVNKEEILAQTLRVMKQNATSMGYEIVVQCQNDDIETMETNSDNDTEMKSNSDNDTKMKDNGAASKHKDNEGSSKRNVIRNKSNFWQMFAYRQHWHRKSMQTASIHFMYHLMVSQLCTMSQNGTSPSIVLRCPNNTSSPSIERIVKHTFDAVMSLFNDAWLRDHMVKSDWIKVPGHGYFIVLDGNAKIKHSICHAAHNGSIELIPGHEYRLTVGCLNAPTKGVFCGDCNDRGIKLPEAEAQRVMNTRSTVKKQETILAELNKWVPKNWYFVEAVCDDKDTVDHLSKEYLVKFIGHKKKQWVDESKLSKKVIESYMKGDDVLWDNVTLEEMDEKLKEAVDAAKGTYSCNTHKDKHGKRKDSPLYYKKARTSGMQVGVCACGIAVTAYQNFRSETLCQQWGQMCSLMIKYPEIDWQKLILGYDDNCHFDAFSLKRKDCIPGITDILAKMRKIIDAYHLPNHQNVGGKKRGCGMKYKKDQYEEMKDVNTERAEQFFSWYSGYRNIVISMNPERFQAFTLSLIHFKNMNKLEELKGLY
eukprot:1049509_1